MADTGKARPVSGEIMTGIDRPSPIGHPLVGLAGGMPDNARDIIDADFVVLPHAGTVPEAPRPPPRAVSTPPVEGMDMLRRPDASAVPPAAKRGGPIFWIAGVSAALAAFWIAGGDALVRHAPLFADARGEGAFTLSGISSRVDATGAKSLLFVDGEAANDGLGTSPLPPLEIRVTGNDGSVTRYTLGTAGRPLAPGERFAFSSRLDVPKNGVRTVSVAFAE